MELFEKNWVDGVKIDQENTEQIIKFLDAGIKALRIPNYFLKRILFSVLIVWYDV